MVTVPDGVAHGTVRLTNPSRYDVPITLICPEFAPEDAKAGSPVATCPKWLRQRT